MRALLAYSPTQLLIGVTGILAHFGYTTEATLVFGAAAGYGIGLLVGMAVKR